MSSTGLRQFARDVRTLGSSAPVRAAYEASKRSGLHSVLLRAGRTDRVGPAQERARVPLLGNSAPTTETARQRCLDDARLILNTGVRVFGQRADTGVTAPWSTDPRTGRRWPTDRAWWKIDIRSAARVSDVKYVWEAARHRDLVVLARASRLDPDGPWVDGLAGMLRSWCQQSSPEHGVNWYSSLELALRSIAWCQVLGLAGDRLPADLTTTMRRHLLASARHIVVELPYTLSSMRNNHMLGDALGLILLARMFPAAPRRGLWQRTGEKMFAAQLARHMRADGSMVEDSLSYHRFVLEMLVVRVVLGDAPAAVRDALHAASQHLLRLGVFDGEVPQWGDWDEGRVLTSSGDALDVAGSAALGLALSGERVPAQWYQAFDELAWYAPAAAPVEDTPVTGHIGQTCSPPRVSVSGGIALIDRGPWRVWFKVGAGPSHGHADLTSVWVTHHGHWLLADPGTGTYNGPLEVRNGLRTSRAHPVLRPDGHDQLGPHRAFRWLTNARGHLAPPVALADRTVVFGWHDAFRRLGPGLRVGRAVIVTDGSVTVIEFVENPDAATSWSLTLPLHPDVEVAGNHLVSAGGTVDFFGLDGHAIVRGQAMPFAGWHSGTYGHWQPATWLDLETDQPGGMVWGFGTTPGTRVGSTVVDGHFYEVRWGENDACLFATDSGGVRHQARAA